ncbi:MAG: HDIG domain-containing metalloprotein, partial [Acidobacteriota bacterium]
EAAMRRYAGTLDGDPDLWGLAGLLHDFDWEIHPTVERHVVEGAPILRARGVPETVVRAIESHHTRGTGVAPSRPIDFALCACDEITGLIIAGALVRPSKDLRQMKVKSVKRNWKDRHFTAAVDRDEVAAAAAAFSDACFDGQLELWTHVGHVLAAMQDTAEALELDGRLAARA